MALPRHILVFRFSALGDIAMCVPVLKNLLNQYPALQITFVSIPFVQPMFEGIDRLSFIGVNIKAEYNGIAGLYRLSKKIKRTLSFDAVADLHDVLRTKVLRKFLGRPTAVIDKGRKERKELTRQHHKNLHPIQTVFKRYADVFEKLGYTITLDIKEGYSKLQPDISLLQNHKDGIINIGIAPFAKHQAKMYPLDKMEGVVEILLKNTQINLYIFSASNECESISHWFDKSERIFRVSGKYNFKQELNLISQLSLMITMDSANMHLASLYDVPVVSVWGGTHPFLGFYGWGQPYDYIIQSDLPCRPSSVFGNKNCPVHGAAGCMQLIRPNMICEKTIEILQQKGKLHAC
ncbi:MAG: glycosyltransferase family 9 protein [Bacteroidetes bacterium]|nr:glycosyltransferase family 9 protein [Bacteroidota bacterium]MBS1757464.1 glycosyltransferase family 9 protein [Bacteroidota bacterium]